MPSGKRGSRNWNGLFDLIDLSAPKRVLPRSMVQPGLAMEQACELGTPFRDLHRLDKEFPLMGRFFNWLIDLVNRLWRSLRPWDQLHLRDLPDPQLQALEWEQDLLLLIGMQSKNLARYGEDMLEPDRISICTWIMCCPFLFFQTRSNTSLTFVVDRRECA